MFKRITALLLALITIFALCACGDEETSKEESKADVSAEASTGTSEDASKDVSSGETSEETSSENTDGGKYNDKKGYEQFQTVAAFDEVLAERGFKDIGANSEYKPLNYDKMKAAWISQFDFNKVYTNGVNQRSVSSFKRMVNQAYDNLISLGFNTVIVQVRPNADSMYPSAYFPYSAYYVGSYGKEAKYDALEVMIELAHEKNLSFQAWINPMRGMSPSNLQKVDDDYVMKSWTKVANKKRCKGYIYEREDDGLCYMDIAFPEVRELIINGAAEIVRHYNVDGIHMDDYFYLADEELDATSYGAAKKKNPSLTLQNFRYNNLNTLVKGIYSAIKAENQNVIFGVSPAGNLDQMATVYYADVRTWLSQDGYVDYIMPQLYFGMEHATWGFADAYQRWAEIKTNPKIKLMVGMSFGKALMGYNNNPDKYAGAGANEWIENKDVLKKCLTHASKQSDFSGYAFFAYQYMFDPLTGKPNPESAQELANVKSVMKNVIKGEPIKY